MPNINVKVGDLLYYNGCVGWVTEIINVKKYLQCKVDWSNGDTTIQTFTWAVLAKCDMEKQRKNLTS
jgi:hypothetical protein